MALLLIVDDAMTVRRVVTGILVPCGHAVLAAENGIKAERILKRRPVELIITDIFMPEQDGLGLLRMVKHCMPDLPVLAISGGGHRLRNDYLPLAARLGADGTLAKPFRPDELVHVVQRLLVASRQKLAARLAKNGADESRQTSTAHRDVRKENEGS